MDTEEEVQFKKPPKKSLKEKLQDRDDLHRHSTLDIQLFIRCARCSYYSIPRRGRISPRHTECISTEETVNEVQPSGSKKGQKGQEIGEQVPERSYVGYYEGTVGLFEKPVEVVSSKGKSSEGMAVPITWILVFVYGITPLASSDDDRHQQPESAKQPKDEKKDVEVSLPEFTETILGDSVVQVSPVVGSDKTKGKVQTPLGEQGFMTPTAESTREGKL